MTLLAELEDRLTEVARRHAIPGAAIAVRRGDDFAEAATGVLNLDTGVETTTDSLFQIGSVTKVFTALLVMQLVDEGLVELDEPVVPARVPDRGRHRRPHGDRTPAAVPHRRLRRGSLRGHRPRRRQPRPLHRLPEPRAAGLAAGHAVLLLQHRLLRPRRDRGEAPRRHVGGQRPRAAPGTVGASADHVVRRGRDPVPRGDGPHGGSADQNAEAEPAMAAATVERAGRSDDLRDAERSDHLRPALPGPRRTGGLPGIARGDADTGGAGARIPAGPGLGPGRGAVRLDRNDGLRPRRRYARPGDPPARRTRNTTSSSRRAATAPA